MKHKEMKCMCTLTDDLVVDIISRLPLKSFCRSKCVCKSWLALSSDQYFCTKLPRTPAGLLSQDRDNSSIQLARLPSGSSEIDTSLSFMPHHEKLELLDCCNGLLLCNHGTTCESADVSHFIVSNPATREWIALPDTRPGLDGSVYVTFLAFDPSWSPHFYVYNFQKRSSPNLELYVITEVEIFSSEDFSWIVNDAFETEVGIISRPHVLLRGVLYLQTIDHSILAIQTPDMYTPWVDNWIIELPGYSSTPMNNYIWGCLGESSGVLHYVQPNYNGCWLEVWRFEGYRAERWAMTQRFSMIDCFGRDVFVHGHCFDEDWSSDYDMVSFDMEREIVFLRDRVGGKVLSYSMSSGELSCIGDLPNKVLYYVPYWHKFPAPEVEI